MQWTHTHTLARAASCSPCNNSQAKVVSCGGKILEFINSNIDSVSLTYMDCFWKPYVLVIVNEGVLTWWL